MSRQIVFAAIVFGLVATHGVLSQTPQDKTDREIIKEEFDANMGPRSVVKLDRLVVRDLKVVDHHGTTCFHVQSWPMTSLEMHDVDGNLGVQLFVACPTEALDGEVFLGLYRNGELKQSWSAKGN